MSTPTSLDIPRDVDAVVIQTGRGEFAAHDALPQGEFRGHLLLIPGFTGSKEDFTPLLGPLARLGWRVTAYDQRGQYETAGTSSDDYSLEGFAADAVAVQAALSPERPSAVLGHSFGGVVAQAAVLAEPASWDRLALLCSGPGALGESELRPLQTFIKAVDQLGLKRLHELRESMVQSQRPSEVARFLARRFSRNSPASIKAIATHLLKAPDIIDDVARLPLRFWVGRGAKDDAWPHEVQAKMAERLGVEIAVIEKSAHSPAIENTDGTVAALASFLA